MLSSSTRVIRAIGPMPFHFQQIEMFLPVETSIELVGRLVISVAWMLDFYQQFLISNYQIEKCNLLRKCSNKYIFRQCNFENVFSIQLRCIHFLKRLFPRIFELFIFFAISWYFNETWRKTTFSWNQEIFFMEKGMPIVHLPCWKNPLHFSMLNSWSAIEM